MIDTDHAEPEIAASIASTQAAAHTSDSTKDRHDDYQKPGWFKKGLSTVGEGLGIIGGGARNSTITVLPKFVVNNASNLAGVAHMVSEVAMFKANGTELMAAVDKNGVALPPGAPRKALDYIKRPVVNIFDSLVAGADLKVSPKSLLKPSFYIDAVKGHFDLKSATDVDLARRNTPEMLAAGKGKLLNSWQARSTMAGMTAWGLNMFLPDVKDTPEETERMSVMATNHPIRYVAERLKQAVLPWEWFQHKRQMTGLGVLVSGICSFLGGFRNVTRPTGANQFYWLNWQYCATGLASICASIPLLFAVDNDKGYSLSGAIHLARCVFLPGSIRKKYKNNEGDGAHYYLLGHLGFQSENLGMALVGGAEKDADGNIVDHKAMRKKAKELALHEKAEHPTHKHLLDAADEVPAQPATKVTRAGDVALAMPERHAIAKAEKRDVASA